MRVQRGKLTKFRSCPIPIANISLIFYKPASGSVSMFSGPIPSLFLFLYLQLMIIHTYSRILFRGRRSNMLEPQKYLRNFMKKKDLVEA